MCVCVLCFWCVCFCCCKLQPPDEENDLHHQEAEIELQRQRKRTEYHSWKGEKVNFDEDNVYPRLLKLQLAADKIQKRKRSRELEALHNAKEELLVAQQAQQLRAENRELLVRAKEWFTKGVLSKSLVLGRCISN